MNGDANSQLKVQISQKKTLYFPGWECKTDIKGKREMKRIVAGKGILTNGGHLP